MRLLIRLLMVATLLLCATESFSAMPLLRGLRTPPQRRVNPSRGGVAGSRDIQTWLRGVQTIPGTG